MRWAAAAAAIAALAALDLGAASLPHVSAVAEVAYLALVVLPLITLSVTLAAAPPPSRAALAGGLVMGGAGAAWLIQSGHPFTAASAAKLVASAAAGMLLGALVGGAVEYVAIAAVIAVVDIASVAAGPTHELAAHHPHTLDALTLNLHALGGGIVQIGCSDIAFFAFFTASAVRLGLRRWAGWAAMTASFGVTLALVYAFDAALPALPLLSVSAVAVNADRLAALAGGRRDSPKWE